MAPGAGRMTMFSLSSAFSADGSAIRIWVRRLRIRVSGAGAESS